MVYPKSPQAVFFFSLPGYQVTGCPILIVNPKLSEGIGEMEEVNGISKKPASGLFSLPGYQVTGRPIILMVNPKPAERIGEDRRGLES